MRIVSRISDAFWTSPGVFGVSIRARAFLRLRSLTGQRPMLHNLTEALNSPRVLSLCLW